MDFDLDPFTDVLPEPASNNAARAGGKFQPKAKPRPRKEAPSTQPTSHPNATVESVTRLTTASSLYDATKEKPITPRASLLDLTQSPSPSVDPGDNKFTHLSSFSANTSTIRPHGTLIANSSPKIIGSPELVNNEALHSGVLLTEGDRNTEPVSSLSHLTVNKEDASSTDALPSEVAVTNSHVDFHSGFGKLGGETADIFFDLESLDNILPLSTTASVSTANKIQGNVDKISQPRNDLITSHLVTTNARDSISSLKGHILRSSNYQDLEEGHNLHILSSVNSSIFRACNSAPTDTSAEFFLPHEPVNSREAAVCDGNGDLQMENQRSEREEVEAFHGLETLDITSDPTTTVNGKFWSKTKVQTGNEKPITPVNVPDASCRQDSQFTPSEIEHLSKGSVPSFPPDGFQDFSTTRSCDSAPTVLPSEIPTEEPRSFVEDSSVDIVILEEIVNLQAVTGRSRRLGRKNKTSTISEETVKKVHFQNFEALSEGAQDERPISAAGEENGASKSSRKPRKRINVCDSADEIEDRIHENGNLSMEPSNSSAMDEDDNEYRGEDTSRKRSAPRKPKKPAAEHEKLVRRRKKASEGPDLLNKESPKKKFSHSTRQNRRKVDKGLFETPEDEINPQKLIIKDLILLAEAKERISNKEAAALKKSVPNQSANISFPYDAPFNDEDPFASAQGLNSDDDQTTSRVQFSSSKLNYHSFMDRAPSKRWSKQDTELFYEAIRQFGTDFAMVEQLFPGRTRHQVKLKYKKEERQHPLRLSDALTNRSKDNSHFELVIEQLQAAAQVEKNSNGDLDSVNVTGEEEATPEDNEEVAKSDLKVEEQVAKEAPEVYSPVKSHESEDDLYLWSQYKSAVDSYPDDTGKDDYELY